MESSSPPPLLKSRVRVLAFSNFPSFLVFFLVKISIAGSSIPPYADHCNAVVPEPSPTTSRISHAGLPIEIRRAFFEGGEGLFRGFLRNPSGRSGGFVDFQPQFAYRTLAAGVLQVHGELTLRYGWEPENRHRRRRLHSLKLAVPQGLWYGHTASFMLEGFWSSISGKLCMVGHGAFGFDFGHRSFAVLKLNFRNSSIINADLVNGTLESVNVDAGRQSTFQPVYILGVQLMNHDCSLVEKENENGGFSTYDGFENASLGWGTPPIGCDLLKKMPYFKLEYEGTCSTVKCSPLGWSSDYLPSFMFFDEIRCLDKHRMWAMLRFSEHSSNNYNLRFSPSRTLVAEGIWDEEKKRACFIACRFINFSNFLSSAILGDCFAKLCLRFPATLSVRNSSTVVGQIWSNKTVGDTGYFSRILFRGHGQERLESGLKYEYTEIEKARALCDRQRPGKPKGGTYPDGYSQDMRLDMRVKAKDGQEIMGRLSPLTVGDHFYEHGFSELVLKPAKDAVLKNINDSSILGISYRISFMASSGFSLVHEFNYTKYPDISAEGTYNTRTGMLCMIGCRQLPTYSRLRKKNETLDCEIVVRIQHNPSNAKGRASVAGSIVSTRAKSDPLYFAPLEMSSHSIYMHQATESILRMDLEIIMVLISNTLACVFVGLQLFYVKKHPDVLPFISIVMLIGLTFVRLIPLVLNFEALFLTNHNRRNVFLGSGGWLEINEVIIRVVLMIDFLLHFRLLQMTWTSRGDGECQKGLSVSEKKVIYMSLPLYVGGGLILLFAHRLEGSKLSPFLRRKLKYKKNYYLWGGRLRSYAGLVLDGFLLPQIMFNLFSNSQVKALAPSFYVGTTAVRVLPHAYDLYRTRKYPWSLSLSFIYADPKVDFYSTALDIIIPCCGLLFALLIYLQQRFGGCCCLPKRFRASTIYEKVPVAVASSE